MACGWGEVSGGGDGRQGGRGVRLSDRVRRGRLGEGWLPTDLSISAAWAQSAEEAEPNPPAAPPPNYLSVPRPLFSSSLPPSFPPSRPPSILPPSLPPFFLSSLLLRRQQPRLQNYGSVLSWELTASSTAVQLSDGGDSKKGWQRRPSCTMGTYSKYKNRWKKTGSNQKNKNMEQKLMNWHFFCSVRVNQKCHFIQNMSLESLTINSKLHRRNLQLITES